MMVPVTRVLLLVCAALVLGIVALLVTADHAWSPPNPHPVDVTTFEVATLERNQPAADQLGEIAERPLFASSRRPVVVTPPTASAPPEPLEGAKVLGVFGHAGAWGAILLIEDKVRRVVPGERMGQWRLAQVKGDVLEFEGEAGARTTLKIAHLPQVAAPSVGEMPPVDPAAGGQRSARPQPDADSGEQQAQAPDAKSSPPDQKRQR